MPYKDPERKREYNRKYYQEHKEECNARSRKYTQEHREQEIARLRKWQREHPKQDKARHKKYRQEHREQEIIRHRKYRKTHKEYINTFLRKRYHEHLEEEHARGRKYRLEHPEENRVKSQRRRACKLSAPGSHTAKEIEFLRSISGGFCPGYNRGPHQVGKENLTADHTIPLSRSGSDCIENIRMICGPCNSAKGTN